MLCLADETLRARKEHQCGGCLGTIGVGDRYRRQRIVDNGDAWVWKSHLLCDTIAGHLYWELELAYDEMVSSEEIVAVLRTVWCWV